MVGGEIFDDTPIPDGTETDLAYGVYLEGPDRHGASRGTLDPRPRDRAGSRPLGRPGGPPFSCSTPRLKTLHPVGYVHTDGIQSWAGPQRLRLFDVTIVTAGVGLQTQPHQFGPQTIDTWEYRRLNIRQTTAAAYALWKEPAAGGWWREIHEDYVGAKPRDTSPGPISLTGIRVERGGSRALKLRLGVPPGGDFVPEGSVGMSGLRTLRRAQS